LIEISSNTAKYIFLTPCKFIINNVEIIAFQVELFKNPQYLMNQEISAERERSIAIWYAPQTDKVTIHTNIEPHL
jgi:hypothetical protein